MGQNVCQGTRILPLFTLVVTLGTPQNWTSLSGSVNCLCVFNVNKIPLVVVLSELNTVKSATAVLSSSTGSSGGVLDGKSGSIGSKGKKVRFPPDKIIIYKEYPRSIGNPVPLVSL